MFSLCVFICPVAETQTGESQPLSQDQTLPVDPGFTIRPDVLSALWSSAMAQEGNCDKDGKKAQKLQKQTLCISSSYLKKSTTLSHFELSRHCNVSRMPCAKSQYNISYGCVARSLFSLFFYLNPNEINFVTKLSLFIINGDNLVGLDCHQQ